jgi:hypothetical protein
MISLPAFADEPGRVKAALGSIAVERRDALGFDLVIAIQIALPEPSWV